MIQEESIEMLAMQYLDGELNHESETRLFIALAASPALRENFRQMQMLKKSARENSEEMPASLEAKIFRSLPVVNQPRWFTPVFRYALPAAAAVLAGICIWFFTEMNYYHNELNNLSQTVHRQNQTIRVLYQSLPSTEVTANFKNEITVKPVKQENL